MKIERQLIATTLSIAQSTACVEEPFDKAPMVASLSLLIGYDANCGANRRRDVLPATVAMPGASRYDRWAPPDRA